MAEPVKIIAEEWDLEEWLDREIKTTKGQLVNFQAIFGENGKYLAGYLAALMRVKQELQA